MANIKLASGYKPIPEGEHIFRIYGVDYEPTFGKLVIHMVNAQGMTLHERFSLLDNNNEPNTRAYNALSIFAKNALNNFKLDEIDHTDLIDRYIKCEIVHNVSPSTKEPGKTTTFVNTGKKYPADGFDTEPVERALTLGKTPKEEAVSEEKPAEVTGAVDLGSLLD
jgi:hypothetical protein